MGTAFPPVPITCGSSKGAIKYLSQSDSAVASSSRNATMSLEEEDMPVFLANDNPELLLFAII